MNIHYICLCYVIKMTEYLGKVCTIKVVKTVK